MIRREARQDAKARRVVKAARAYVRWRRSSPEHGYDEDMRRMELIFRELERSVDALEKKS